VGDQIFLHRVEHRIVRLWNELSDRGCLLTVCSILQDKTFGAEFSL
jgi:hypothetical protein